MSDEKLLKEIRDNFRLADSYWRSARAQRKIDMRYVCGNPWSKKDRKARKDAGRPCISHDELNQYINQSVNNLRMNPRGIKVEPSDEATNEKTAELRQGLIRAIEYGSNAQQAYMNAAQAMYEGSYGFFRITREYVSDDSFNQKIVIKTIPNPDSVLYYPHCKEPDWSDAKWVFVIEEMDVEEFKDTFPRAKVVNFTNEDRQTASDWILQNSVMVAEYWKVESKPYTLYELEDGTTTRDLPEGAKAVRERESADKQVMQYLTNGLEILQRTEQPGDQIPIPAVIGLVRYVDDEGGTEDDEEEGATEGGTDGKVKRVLFSQVRLARDPQMSLAYLNSLEMEEAGLTPKTPFLGYVGQFETDKLAWDTITTQPHGRVQVDPVPDSANGQILPLPQRLPFSPNFQSYEIAKDSCRRSIQAAMGISPLPTAAQRNNEKSGIALKQIQSQEQIGSFHFTDGFERALQRAGRIIDSWIPVVYDTERAEPIRKPDDTHQMIRLNTADPYVDERGMAQHHVVEEGDHNVTISVGPSTESQRAASEATLDSLLGNLPILVQLIGPERTAKMLSLSLQMKQLGPKGDEIAELISPSDAPGANLPPQVQAAMAQSQQQLQALNAHAQQLEQQIQTLTFEKNAKVTENQGRIQLEQVKAQNDLALENKKLENQLTIAEVTAKAQIVPERAQMVADMWKQLHEHAHDVGLQAAEQAHERVIQAAEQQHEAQMGAQEHQQALEQQAAQPQPEAQPEPQQAAS